MDPASLEPGDLVLVKSRGLVFAVGRRVGGNAYDHVGVVVDGGQTVNIDKPRTRLVPAARLVRDELEPLVLRPRWPSSDARAAFVRWIGELAGKDYDVRRTLRLIARLIVKRALRVAWRLPRPRPDAPRWICTDAVLLGLEQFAGARDALRELPLDWNALGCGTTNDLLVISERRPDLLHALTRRL